MLNEKENGGTRKEKEKGQRESEAKCVCVCMGACMCVERKILCGSMLVCDVRM